MQAGAIPAAANWPNTSLKQTRCPPKSRDGRGEVCGVIDRLLSKHKAYRLQIRDGYFDAKHISFGRHVCSIKAGELRKPLSAFMMEDGNINGGELSNTWFPEVQAQVFISHSHADTELAHGLAGWLFEKFGINGFIDSALWGHCAQLLELICREHAPMLSLCAPAPTAPSASKAGAMASLACAARMANGTATFIPVSRTLGRRVIPSATPLAFTGSAKSGKIPSTKRRNRRRHWSPPAGGWAGLRHDRGAPGKS